MQSFYSIKKITVMLCMLFSLSFFKAVASSLPPNDSISFSDPDLINSLETKSKGHLSIPAVNTINAILFLEENYKGKSNDKSSTGGTYLHSKKQQLYLANYTKLSFVSKTKRIYSVSFTLDKSPNSGNFYYDWTNGENEKKILYTENEGTGKYEYIITEENPSNKLTLLNAGKKIHIKSIKIIYADGSEEARTISIGKEHYATLYSDKNLYIPKGIGIQIIKLNKKNKPEIGIVTELSEREGYLTRTVPAHTGALLYCPTDTTVKLVESPINNEYLKNPYGKNILKGSVRDSITGDGVYYYMLSLNKANDPASVGFYWANPDGSAFTNQGGKAYLALSEEVGSQLSSFPLSPALTALNKMTTQEKSLKRQGIYDILGRSCKKNAKGLQIVNGKKIFKF